MKANTSTVQIKLNVTIQTIEMNAWFGKTDAAGKNITEARYRAVATAYGQEIASTEYVHKTQKAATHAVKFDIATANEVAA